MLYYCVYYFSATAGFAQNSRCCTIVSTTSVPQQVLHRTPGAVLLCLLLQCHSRFCTELQVLYYCVYYFCATAGFAQNSRCCTIVSTTSVPQQVSHRTPGTVLLCLLLQCSSRFCTELQVLYYCVYYFSATAGFAQNSRCCTIVSTTSVPQQVLHRTPGAVLLCLLLQCHSRFCTELQVLYYCVYYFSATAGFAQNSRCCTIVFTTSVPQQVLHRTPGAVLLCQLLQCHSRFCTELQVLYYCVYYFSATACFAQNSRCCTIVSTTSVPQQVLHSTPGAVLLCLLLQCHNRFCTEVQVLYYYVYYFSATAGFAQNCSKLYNVVQSIVTTMKLKNPFRVLNFRNIRLSVVVLTLGLSVLCLLDVSACLFLEF